MKNGLLRLDGFLAHKLQFASDVLPMGKLYESLTPELQGLLAQRKVFFVAPAPMAQDGQINCSPIREHFDQPPV